MVKDFKALAGTTPSKFFQLIEDGFKPRRTVDTVAMSVFY
jgi:hypothetical protein